MYAFCVALSTHGLCYADYEKFFAKALEQDSGSGATYAAEIAALFESDREGFIKALHQAPSEQVNLIVGWLVFGHDRDLPGFRQQILELLDDEAFGGEVPLLNQILEEISLQEESSHRIAAELERERPPSERDTYPFLPEFVTERIQARKDSGRLNDADEEFSNWLMEKYRMDPELFAKCVACFDDDDVGIIAKRVAHALLKMDEDIPQVERWRDLSEREVEALDLLESRIAKVVSWFRPALTQDDSTSRETTEHLLTLGVVVIIVAGITFLVQRRRRV